MPREYNQGKYIVQKPEKYRGDYTKVRYLSSYEKHFFEWCDRSPSVLEWSSENVVVPYFDPIKNKKRRYLVDVWMRYVDKQGQIKEAICEIKPDSQCKMPVKGRKKASTFDQEMMTFLTNKAKWEAAQEWARSRGWDFRLITENQIFR